MYSYYRNLRDSTPIYIGTIPLSNYQIPQPSEKAKEIYPLPSAPEESPNYPSPTSNLYPNLGKYNLYYLLNSKPFLLFTLRLIEIYKILLKIYLFLLNLQLLFLKCVVEKLFADGLKSCNYKLLNKVQD
jgi:hypothetical protein